MPSSLTAMLIAAHRPEAAARRKSGESAEPPIRIDQGLVSESRMNLVLAAFESLGRARLRVQPALVALERAPGLGSGRDSGALGEQLERWRRAGAWCSTAGAGIADVLHRDAFAAPGRMVVCAGRPLPPCGVFASLAWSASELATAAALATGRLAIEPPRVIGVWLGAGARRPWVGGVDVALEVLRRMPPGSREGAVVELTGPGVSGLPIDDRNRIATTLGLSGVFALLPSDEVTRRALQACGRESDWRRLEADQNAAFDERIEIELESLMSSYAPLGAPEHARGLGDGAGLAISRVLVGPHASVGDLETIVRLLREARTTSAPGVDATVRLVVVPGSRAVAEAAVALGTAAALIEAGAHILEPGGIPSWGAEGAGVCYGVRIEDVRDDRGAWLVAGPEACALAARAGALADPADLTLPPPPDSERFPGLVGGSGTGLLLPPFPEGPGPTRAPGAWSRGAPLDRAFRGEVLAKLGNRVECDEVLPHGARLAALEGDVVAHAAHALTSLDPEFAARARERGGGVLVAGGSFGLGEPRGSTAPALAELGVRAVLARSFSAAFHASLVEAGVLPLCFATDADYDAVSRGDELEVPGLPEALEPGRPLAARNLTQGTHCNLRHELDARAVDVARAGGLLAWTRETQDLDREDDA